MRHDLQFRFTDYNTLAPVSCEGPPAGAFCKKKEFKQNNSLSQQKKENRQPWEDFVERKKTDNPREGWEDGTPPPHRDLGGFLYTEAVPRYDFLVPAVSNAL